MAEALGRLAVARGESVRELLVGVLDLLVYGTTAATHAIVTHEPARTALLTTNEVDRFRGHPTVWASSPGSGAPYAEPQATVPAQVRAEAVRLGGSPGNSIRLVAGDLGVSNESLRRWVQHADIDRGAAPGLTTDERAELTRLRPEN